MESKGEGYMLLLSNVIWVVWVGLVMVWIGFGGFGILGGLD